MESRSLHCSQTLERRLEFFIGLALIIDGGITLLVVEYTHEHAARVKAFNERLRRAGSSLQFDAEPAHSHDLVGVENEIRHRHFIAADDDGWCGARTR